MATGPAGPVAPTRVRWVSTLVTVLVCLLAMVGFGGLAPSAGAARAVVGAATAGCAPIGGTATSDNGPHRATVVVDPGSGDVWSACISFSGPISGIDALNLAADEIPGLDPVYEYHSAQGNAVCRLLGVGNDPPNCLSKSVEYWAYFRNGEYSRVGASRAVVVDGSVEGWSFSRGTPPRPATRGTKAVDAAAMPTIPPASDPPATEVPLPPTTAGDSEAPDTDPTDPVIVPGHEPGEPTTTAATSPTSSAPVDVEEGDRVGDGGGGHDTDRQPGRDSERNAGASGVTVSTQSDDDGGSGIGSAVGFGAALGMVALAAVVARRRRVMVADPAGRSPE